MNYFFDTYAVLEIMQNSKNYEKYKGEIITTSILNMAEIYYFLLRTQDQKTADFLIKRMDFRLVNVIRLDIALEASKLRFENKKEDISYIDCIGYCIAKSMNLKFLTGDEKFRDKVNVEFVK